MKEKILSPGVLLIMFIVLMSSSYFLMPSKDNHLTTSSPTPQDSTNAQTASNEIQALPQSSDSIYVRDQFDGGFDPSTPSCVTFHPNDCGQPAIMRLLEVCYNSIDPVTQFPKSVLYEYALNSSCLLASPDLDKEITVYPVSCDKYCREAGFTNGICSPASINCADQVVTAGYCNCAP